MVRDFLNGSSVPGFPFMHVSNICQEWPVKYPGRFSQDFFFCVTWLRLNLIVMAMAQKRRVLAVPLVVRGRSGVLKHCTKWEKASKPMRKCPACPPLKQTQID